MTESNPFQTRAHPANYRKKPVLIQAVQYLRLYNIGTIVTWINDNGGDAAIIPWNDDIDYISIETLEGRMGAFPDDWIIRGVQGEFYPCKPDIFEATYDSV